MDWARKGFEDLAIVEGEVHPGLSESMLGVVSTAYYPGYAWGTLGPRARAALLSLVK